MTTDLKSGFATTAETRARRKKAVEWLTNTRKIDVETIARFGIRTDDDGNVVFPFFHDGKLVNEKTRRVDVKDFWQWKTDHPGRKSTFFNADVLDEPSLQNDQVLVITEGEIDCLTAAQAGYFAVSVPDGAGHIAGDAKFLVNNRDRIKKVRRFVLAVDSDEPGQQLAQSLLAYLSAASCLRVTYPEGCTDLNDVLCKHGLNEVGNVLSAATPYPIEGLYDWDDYVNTTQIEAVSTGWLDLDEYFKPFRGGLTIMTGVPSHGKSTFAINLLVSLALQHGWSTAIFSPEVPVAPFLRSMVMKIHGGEREEVRAFGQKHFKFIDADPRGDKIAPAFTLNWILDRATEAVLRFGIQCLLIDPWNEMDFCRERGESMTDYVGRALREIKAFARQRHVAVIILAHPAKSVWRENSLNVPTLYDIADSAHFYNKCDHGLVIWRPKDRPEGTAELHVSKVRFRGTGKRGIVFMNFDEETMRFTPNRDAGAVDGQTG